jgi:hypothetical protein
MGPSQYFSSRKSRFRLHTKCALLDGMPKEEEKIAVILL